MTIHPQFVVDEKGKKKSVLLSLKEYKELLKLAKVSEMGDYPDEHSGGVVLGRDVVLAYNLDPMSAIIDETPG